jgi:ATP-dependent exoDNAse (exonuclease V) alpha subunit
VIVVDEAGMVGTRKLARLLDHADHHHARVVLVGDPRQLPEIGAGGLFARLTTEADPIVLSQNRRQRHAWERAALRELRAGDVAAAVNAYAAHDRIHITPDAHHAHTALLADWWAARHDGHHAAIYAVRRADVAQLNAGARFLLHAEGQLGPDTPIGPVALAAGDQVLATRRHRDAGLVNGTRGVITGIDPAHRLVHLEVDDRAVAVGFEFVEAGHLTHGYATTVHKAQGATVDRAFVLGADSLYREAGYVALSRATQRSDLYLIAGDPHAAELEPHGTPRDTRAADPLDELTRDLAQSRAQHLALASLDADRAGRLLDASPDAARDAARDAERTRRLLAAARAADRDDDLGISR